MEDKFSVRQKEIIKASCDIIAGEGIKALTVRNIASKIRTTDAAIYKHFKSKDEILQGIVYVFRSGTTEILKRLSDANKPYIDRVMEFFLGRCMQFENDKSMAIVMFPHDIFKNDKKILSAIVQTVEEHGSMLAEIIKKGQANGEIRADIPAGHLFVMIMGSLRLLITRWRGSNYAFSLVAEGEQLWKSLEKLIEKQ